MIEKRFYLMNVEDPLHEYGRWCKPVLEDGKTGKQYENALEVMDLLNRYDKECKIYRRDALKAEKDKEKLLEKNEQLKQELAIYRKLISCSNCKYHNYDWYDDGDEFEVCDKGNDVTDGICEDWEEIE